MDPAEHPAEHPLPVDPADHPARQHSPVGPASIPPEQLASLVLLNVPPGAQLGLHFRLASSCFECALRLGQGDAFVLLWVVNKKATLFNPPSFFFWKGLGFCERNRCLSSRDRLAHKWSLTHTQVDKALNAKLVEQS